MNNTKQQLKLAIQKANEVHGAWEAAGRPAKGAVTYAAMVAANKECNRLQLELSGSLIPQI